MARPAQCVARLNNAARSNGLKCTLSAAKWTPALNVSGSAKPRHSMDWPHLRHLSRMRRAPRKSLRSAAVHGLKPVGRFCDRDGRRRANCFSARRGRRRCRTRAIALRRPDRLAFAGDCQGGQAAGTLDGIDLRRRAPEIGIVYQDHALSAPAGQSGPHRSPRLLLRTGRGSRSAGAIVRRWQHPPCASAGLFVLRIHLLPGDA